MLARGPYLIAAVICERVLQERDGVPSIIRIVDRITFHGPPEQRDAIVTGLHLFLAFRGSRAGAVHSVRIAPINADGVELSHDREPISVKVAEGLDGANLAFVLASPFPGPGQYFFEVSIDGELLTRIPLAIAIGELPESLRPTPTESQ